MRQFGILTALLLVLSLLPPALVYGANPAPETAFERQCSEVSAAGVHGDERARLWKLFDVCWQYEMTEFPEWATSVGYPGQNGRWTDLSREAIARRKREVDAPLKVLQSIDRAQLNPADQLNYDLLKYKLELDKEGVDFPEELMPINQLQGIQQSAATTVMDNPTNTVKDYEDILSRLRGVPTVVDQTIALMKAGLAAKITPPKVTLRDVPEQIRNQIVEDPSMSALLEPFKDFPAAIPQADRLRLVATAKSIIKEEIVPSYNKLLQFFVREYLPKCRDSIAFTALPDGRKWYAHRVRENTTTHLTAEEIHEIGLAEVRRLRAEMEPLIRETGFKGSFQEFSEFVRTDKQFFFEDPESLLVAYRDIAKRIDPELIKQFGKLPRLPYGIKPIPAFSEKSQPTAYYQMGTPDPGRPGIFFANTYDLKSRPKWEMEALTLHEAVPGHHLQVSLAQEMENLPNFRRYGGFNAYVEGWGLYAEGLGPEMGMYKDPYSRYGQLTYDMWRSIRLVLDTGIHSKGWSRQKAIDFFRENSSKTDHDIEVEVDRYIVWPGQALAYKLGQLTIQELKAKAKQELGEHFDVRKFHDAVLAMGAVPLDVLKAQMDQWMHRLTESSHNVSSRSERSQ